MIKPSSIDNATMANANSTTSASDDSILTSFRLARVLLPRRVDFVILIGCLIAVAGLLDPFLGQQFFLYRTSSSFGIGNLGLALGLCSACLAAIAISLGWRKLFLHGGVLGIASCAVALTAFLWAYFETWKIWQLVDRRYSGFSPSFENSIFAHETVFMFVVRRLGGAAVGFFALFLLTRGFLLLLERLKKHGSRQAKLSRTHWLIGLAIVLFVANFVQSQFFPLGFLYSAKAYVSSGIVGRFAIGATGFLLLFLLPSWVLTSSVKFRWKMLALGVLAAAFISAYEIRNNVTQPGFEERTLTLVNGIVVYSFYLVLLGVSMNESKASNGHAKFVGPSIWSTIPIAMFLTVAYVVYFFDFAALTRSAIFEWPKVNFRAARVAKTIARESDYRIGVVDRYLVADMNGAASSQGLFDGFDVTVVPSVDLSNLTPDTDVSGLYGCSFLRLKDCTVTSEQLAGLLKAAKQIFIENVEVVDPGDSVSFPENASVDVSYSRNDIFRSFADSIQFKVENVPIVHVRLSKDALGKAESDGLIRLSQSFPIYINDKTFSVLRKHVDEGSMQLLADVIVCIGPLDDAHITKPAIGSSSFQFLMESNVFVVEKISQSGGYGFWDFAFAKNVQTQPLFWGFDFANCCCDRSAFLELAARNHWNFGNDPSAIKKLFIPGIDMWFSDALCAVVMSDVEVLCLDPQWLCRSDAETDYFLNLYGGYVRQQFDYESINKLTKLKRLDLNPDVAVGDFTFLTRIPTVEHLQIRFDDIVATQVDFRVCRKLKTLVYFGLPDVGMIAQLRVLKNLDSVTIVYNGAVVTKADVAALKNSLPGVALKFVAEQNFQPTPPKEFLEHVKQRSAEIRQRWGVSPQKSND